MKKLASLILIVALFLLAPFNAMEQAANQDLVSHAGLQREHVLLALWVNASGTGGTRDDGDTRAYLLTSSMPLPTYEEAKNYLAKSDSGGYFQGRKVLDAFSDNDTYNGYGYNQCHGLQRAQKVIKALQARAESITLEGISKLYVSVWKEVREKECDQMNALMKAGKSNEAIMIYRYHSLRSDADCVGVTKAMELDAPMKEKAQGFASGLAHRHLKKTMKQPQSENASHAETIPVTPPSTPARPKEKSAQQDDLSPEVKKMMGPGLRKMFGGKEP